MLAAADTALDLLVLELVLELLLLGVLLLGVLAPVDAGAEDDVLAHRGRVGGRTGGVLSALAELAPCLAVGDAGVHRLLVGDVAHAAGRLDLVAVFVDTVRDDGLGAVLVGDGLGRGQLGGGVFDVVVVGPVVPFDDSGVSQQGSPRKWNSPQVACGTHLGLFAMAAAMMKVWRPLSLCSSSIDGERDVSDAGLIGAATFDRGVY